MTIWGKGGAVRLRGAVIALLTTAGLLLGLSHAPVGEALATWAPAEQASIHPGVQTVSPTGQCTSNFIFTNGADVLIGQAAHCTGTGGATDTNGCLAGSLPLNTPVEIQGASRPGRLVYSSWLAMHAAHESDADTCRYNDFALVRIDAADVARVNPSVPYWGGPNGIDGNGTALGDRVYTYGNSSLRLGLTLLSPKTGTSLGTTGGGWSHTIYTVTPGIPGDSGSGVMSQGGQALGVLVTVAAAPFPLSNGVTDLAHAMNYARSHGVSGLTLVQGTQPFDGSRIPPL
jgi:hypothetical protein